MIIIVPNIKKLMTTDDRKFAERFSLFVKQTFKYYLVGSSGVGIGLVLLYLLTDIVGIWYVISQSIAIGIAMTSNFTLHKFWTYRKESIEGRTLVKYVKFLGAILFCPFICILKAPDLYHLLVLQNHLDYHIDLI